MDAKPLQITLIPAPDDRPEESGEYQAELHEFDQNLQREGFDHSSVVEIMEAVGHDISPYLGVFNVAVGGSLSALSAVVGAWLKGRSGRIVELEIDGTKAKAATIEEVKALMEIAQQYRARNESKRVIP